MKRTVTFTHRGWFGICPVYLADLASAAPHVDPRHWTLEWLMDVSEAIYAACFALQAAADPTFEPSWPLRITGKLSQPITREFQS